MKVPNTAFYEGQNSFSEQIHDEHKSGSRSQNVVTRELLTRDLVPRSKVDSRCVGVHPTQAVCTLHLAAMSGRSSRPRTQPKRSWFSQPSHVPSIVAKGYKRTERSWNLGYSTSSSTTTFLLESQKKYQRKSKKLLRPLPTSLLASATT